MYRIKDSLKNTLKYKKCTIMHGDTQNGNQVCLFSWYNIPIISNIQYECTLCT